MDRSGVYRCQSDFGAIIYELLIKGSNFDLECALYRPIKRQRKLGATSRPPSRGAKPPRKGLDFRVKHFCPNPLLRVKGNFEFYGLKPMKL